MEFLAATCDKVAPMMVSGILVAMRNIGMLDRELLRPHEKLFERLRDEVSQAHDVAQSCLDAMEGRT